MTFDDWTFVVWAGFLPVWLVWEALALALRGQGVHVKTISMVAQKRGYQLPCLPFFWLSMPFHWWIDIGWASRAGTIAFWSLAVAGLVWNLVRWKKTLRPFAEWPRWERWLNWPVWWMAAGPVAAVTLFPQSAPVPWAP